MKKIKETKLGSWLASKAPQVLDVVGDLLPDSGGLGVVKNLKGGKRNTDPNEYLIAFDMSKKGYRNIYYNTIERITVNKQTFNDPYWDEVLLRHRLGEFENTSEGRAEKEMIKYQVELMIAQNRMFGMQEMMLRERNGEFMEYWVQAEFQRTGRPPLFEKDKL